jgi:D-tyrosyl-tRNA(Tyr) deacylase
MRIVLQRVSHASVTVAGEVVGAIQHGVLLLVGIAPEDDTATVELMAEKIVNLRIFPDQQGRFDRSLLDVGGAALVVSQFTLFGDIRRGRRPSFSEAAPPEIAAPLVDAMAAALRTRGVTVAMGRFGQHMQVELLNDGPVTLILESSVFRDPRRGH